MGKKPNDGHITSAPVSHESTPLLLVSTVADTTWRMFVPAVGFTLVGVWLDTVFSTKPLLMFVGIGVGVAAAYVLVRRQIDMIRQDQK